MALGSPQDASPTPTAPSRAAEPPLRHKRPRDASPARFQRATSDAAISATRESRLLTPTATELLGKLRLPLKREPRPPLSHRRLRARNRPPPLPRVRPILRRIDRLLSSVREKG